MDLIHQTIADFLKCNHDTQIICPDRDIRNFSCKFCSITDRNTNICCRKRRRVINSITYHQDFTSLCFSFFYEFCFVLRKYFRIIFIDSNSGCDCFCCAVTVTCHHNDLCEPRFSQCLYNLRCLRAKRIFNADHRGKFPFNSKIQMRIFFRKISEQFFLSDRNCTFFIFKYKMMASYNCFSSIYHC